MRKPSITIRSGMAALVILGASVVSAVPAYAGTTDIDLLGRGYECTPFTSSTGERKSLCTKQGSPPQICDANGDHCHEATLQTGPLTNLGPRATVLEQGSYRPARGALVARPTKHLRR